MLLKSGKIIKYFKLSIISFFFSCSFQEHELKAVSLSGIHMGLQEELSVPTRIEFADSVLVLIDMKALRNTRDSIYNSIHVVSLKTNAIKKSMGVLGSGPGEIIGPWSMSKKPGDRSIWVFDLITSRFLRFSVSDSSGYPSEVVRITKEGDGYFPLWISDATIFSPGFVGGGRLLVYNRKGELLKKIGSFPQNKNKDVAESVHASAYQSCIVYNKKNKKVAMADRYADLIEVYDIQSDKTIYLHSGASFLPVYNMEVALNQKMFSPTAKTIFGYIEICATDSKIYGLYSGASLKTKLPNYGRFIHEFDWDGKLLKAYKLDYPVLAICIDEKSNIIYGVHADPFPDIVKYNL